jgi:hypothetical protein
VEVTHSCAIQTGRLTIPIYGAVAINLVNWILAEAKVTRQEFLKPLK